MVDTLDLGSSVERREGSNPFKGKKSIANIAQLVEQTVCNG